jgi:hypothetical protein
MKTHNLVRVAVVSGALVAGCSGAPPAPSGTQGAESQAQSLAPACVQNVLCKVGDHWDPIACRCVPDVCISQDDGPCGGFVAHPCQCAPGLVCKPNRIPDVPGTCEEQRCCPVGWDMFACREENGSSGLNCHNPRLACPLRRLRRR